MSFASSTSPEPHTPDDNAPAIIVFGCSRSGKPLAGWYAASARGAVITAVAEKGFEMLAVQQIEAADWEGAPEGKFDHKGRVSLSPVDAALYDRLAARARTIGHDDGSDLAGSGPAKHDVLEAAGTPTDPAATQGAPASDADPRRTPPANSAAIDLWEQLQVGDLVLAPEITGKGAINGYWPALVRVLHGDGDLTLAWRDEGPSYPAFRLPRRDVALLSQPAR
jgi:hypothetical protein